MADAAKKATSSSATRWRQGEKKLREREVNRQLWSTVVQATIAVAAITAAFIAGLAALRASDAIDVAKKGIQSQAEENRLSTAVDAVGGDTSVERVAGLTFLRRLATEKLDIASKSDATDSDRRDAMSFYRATVDILATYLKTPPATPATFGIGDPQLPPDVAYATNDLRQWLDRRATFLKLSRGDPKERPKIGLERAWLYGVYWRGIDFAWLGSRNLVGVDLRNATLDNSKWKKSSFDDAHLGCASLLGSNLRRSEFTDGDAHSASLTGSNLQLTTMVRTNLRGANLQNANLRNADLTDADLRGANLTGADLRGANLTGAMVTGVATDGAKFESGAFDQVRTDPQPPTRSAFEIDPACPDPAL